ncbi:mechanosensitive ion channel family protein [Candidatus Saccharibacteria bacterium]|nr:mechanosensitive ion channel family protein [Candidatus Saccharibacteria bacterium]
MIQFFAATSDIDVEQTKSALQKVGESIFNWESLVILFVCIAAALIAGSLFAFLVRKITKSVARSADQATNLGTVNRLRRVETTLIISIAIIRLLLVVMAVYVWWAITHPNSSSASSVIGAGALTAVILGGALTPLLRDFSFGAGMMAERWFGVGDLISIDFPNVQGVVERITLRSTKIRGLNGEVIWVANQTINGVKVAQKGVRRTAIEIFANDPDAAEAMVEKVNKLLPGGLSLLVSPLEVVEVEQRDEDIWHITAVGETAPEREWILEKAAVDIFKQLDAKLEKPLLIVDPVPRYADKDTERLISRAVKNARKTQRSYKHRKVVKDERDAYKR